MPQLTWRHRRKKPDKDLGTRYGGDHVGKKWISQYKPCSGKGQRESLVLGIIMARKTPLPYMKRVENPNLQDHNFHRGRQMHGIIQGSL